MLSQFPYSNNDDKKFNDQIDLCSTCNNAEYCLQDNKIIRPVIFCEEFDDYVPVKSKIVKKLQPKKESLTLSDEKDVKKYLGLCRNCDNNKTCAHNIPEGGIWHCEDYQ